MAASPISAFLAKVRSRFPSPAALAVLDDVRKLPLKIADIFRKLTI